jgi:hypothetical protein
MKLECNKKVKIMKKEQTIIREKNIVLKINGD